VDGIFGVGVAELIIVGLALFIIGGPENTAKWARQLGLWVHKARQAWAQVMADMEREMGPEGKEIMDAARQLGQGARDVTNLNPTRRLMGETMRQLEGALDLEEKPTPTPAAPPPAAGGAPGANGSSPDRYRAWQPPDDKDQGSR